MKLQEMEKRINASLRQQLLAVPAELRALATAETVDWLFPEFETDEPQQAAIHALLRACSDGRSVVFRHRADSDCGVDEQALATAAARRQGGTERLIALDRAVAAGICAGRILRQRGVKPTIMTRERIDDTTGQTVLARTDLGFRRRSIAWRAP
jgi:hypothetical protein